MVKYKYPVEMNDVAAENVETLLESFKHRLQKDPNEKAFVWYEEGERVSDSVTFQELWDRAIIVAAFLQQKGCAGRNVVLLYPIEGLDYIVGFYGCMLSGAVPVPTYPPDPTQIHRTMARFAGILADCECAALITTTGIMQQMSGVLGMFPAMKKYAIYPVDKLDPALAKAFVEPELTGRSTAFLQYTSGSTGSPKGVIISQERLIQCMYGIASHFNVPRHPVACGWIPLYHDMGLIGFVTYSVFYCATIHLMSPFSFLKKPYRWLKLCSDTKSTITGGPNFAYDLCSLKITPEQMKTLDLSHLRLAFSGSELVRPQTIEYFTTKFGHCGFDPHSFMPVYGMAESVLLVTGQKFGYIPTVTNFWAADLEKGVARAAFVQAPGTRACVSIGVSSYGDAYKIIIVNPETLEEIPANHIGEIWLETEAAADGYYNKPEITEKTFHAQLKGGDGTHFLRTGDLGFFHNGELYIVGREKDLIIIHGKNHYPQDIETSTYKNKGVKMGCGAAFSVEVEQEERLILVNEVEENFEKAGALQLIRGIRDAVAKEHDIMAHAIILIKPNTIPRTSSNKIQRSACKGLYLKNGFEVFYQWSVEDAPLPEPVLAAPVPVAAAATTPAATTTPSVTPSVTPSTTPAAAKTAQKLSEKAQEIAERIRKSIEEKVSKKVEVRLDIPFSNYGMSSADIIGLAGELEDWLKVKLPPTLLYEFPTIEQLARHLAGDDDIVIDELGDAATAGNSEPVAIVGMSCRFPGARNKEEFWDLMVNGVDAVRRIPGDRFDAERFYDPTPRTPGKMYVREGGFIEDVDLFDSRFFNIAKSEAAAMDPQQRLLLTCTQEAFDDAGENTDMLAGSRTAVAVAVSSSDYIQVQSGKDGAASVSSAYMATGSAGSICSNRISYQYDLQGPSVTVDSACSSSLVALDIAVRYIQQGRCERAVVGGSNLILSPQPLIALCQANFLAADGRCKAFDASADGFGRSEGVGVVIVKPLSAAKAAGDRVYAVVRGVAVNQDGRSNGLTAPNPLSQKRLVVEACRKAGVAPAALQYIECHGTGTALGDPIEVKALDAVLARGRADGAAPTLIGSVKSNIGHLEACAGLAGLMKLALSIYHRQIPASIHFKTPNPKIGLDEMTTLKVNDKLVEWPLPADTKEALGGVSSFGFGGTNAHAILSSAPEGTNKARSKAPAPAREGQEYMLALSAESENTLRATVSKYAAWLGDETANTADIGAICAALLRRVAPKHYRAGFLGRSKAEVVAQMREWLVQGGNPDKKRVSSARPAARPGEVCFVFSGQGPQWYAMGRELYASEPYFRETFTGLAKLFMTKFPLDWSIPEQMSKGSNEETMLGETKVAQVLIFMLQVSVARFLIHTGVAPSAVIGHSLGELAAACIAGLLDDETAARIVYERSVLMQKTTGMGRMCAVRLSAEDVAPFIDKYSGKISLGVYNAPRSVVITGEEAEIEKCLADIRGTHPDVHAQYLPVNYVFHSPQLDFAVPILREKLADVRPAANALKSTVRMYSTVTGSPIDAASLTGEYWATQVRKPVLFSLAVANALKDGYGAMVEVAPHPVLGLYIRSAMEELAVGAEGIVHPTLVRREPERLNLANVVLDLWTHGARVDPLRFMFPAAFEDGETLAAASDFVQLPTRVWEPQSFWPASVPDYCEPSPLAEPSKRMEESLYDTQFVAAPLDEAETEALPALRMLVFADKGAEFSIADALVKGAATNAIVVRRGAEFRKVSDTEYEAALAAKDFAAVLDACKGKCGAVVYCWANDAKTAADWDVVLTGTVLLAQAMVRGSWGSRTPLLVATNNATGITKSSAKTATAVHSAQAAVIGCVLAFSAEYPEMRAGIVDVAEESDAATHLATEVRYAAATAARGAAAIEACVTLHQGVRAVARMSRVAPSLPAAQTWVDAVRVDARGVYLITGGLGGLGLETARWLCARGCRHLVLVDKFPASERAEGILAELRKTVGEEGSIEVAIAPVEDKAAMEALIKRTSSEEERPLRGVFHYAGVLVRGAFAQITPDAVRDSVQAKILGGAVLDEITRGIPSVDVFAVSSSISAWAPQVGQALYAAGNAYLLGLVAERRALGLPATAVCIGLLGGVGMIAQQSKENLERIAQDGICTTPASDVLAVLSQLITRDIAAALFARVDWTRYAPASPLFSRVVVSRKHTRKHAAASTTTATRNAEEAAIDEEDEDETESIPLRTADEVDDWLVRNFADALHVEARELDPSAPLSNYGLQSVTVMDIATQLSQWIGFKISPNIVYDFPTINALTKHLSELSAQRATSTKKKKDSKKALVPANASIERPISSGMGSNEGIAVIGMACKFPGGCNDLDSYWDLLVNGRDAVTEYPAERFDVNEFYDPDHQAPGKMNSKWGGFVDAIDMFDAEFWSISPREADRLDPQQRMCLEMAWEALEDAGQCPARLAGGRHGVFVGLSVSDYGQLELLEDSVADAYFSTGSFICMNANRLSYLLGFQGPSVAMDTACSSSTVATHLACNSIRNGEAELCLAGGVNAILTPTGGLTLTKTTALSPDGHCFTFDERANGFVRAEGCGMVVLKRLSAALADGDRIHCVIAGSAVNQDGHSQGLTAPNGLAQQALLEEAYRRAGRDIADLAYIECHGTGTSLGDHIEVEAIGQVLGRHHRAGSSRVVLASVKANIGHLECASGMASLVKVALAMEHDFIPASIHSENPNPHIDFEHIPVTVSHGCEWPADKPRLAGISSFGFGGTNAHLVIEAAPAQQQSVKDRQPVPAAEPYVLAISARTLDALRATAARLADYLEGTKEAQRLSLRDICYSLLERHEQHPYRQVFVQKCGGDADEKGVTARFVKDLRALAAQESAALKVPRPLHAPRVCFVFSGQGPQHWGMARGLLRDSAVFRAAIEEVDAEFAKQEPPFSVVAELTQDDEGASHLGETVCAQRVLFAIQYALVRLYESVGVRAASVVGHSLGEIAAAVCAGILTLPAAAELIYVRSEIMNRATGLGRMLAVGLPPAECAKFVAEGVALAASNSGKSCTMSGASAALEAAAKAISRAHPEAFVKFLPVDYAFHSPQMEALAKELTERVGAMPAVLATADPSSRVAMYSTLTGERVTKGAQFDAEYWGSQVRNTVRFYEAVTRAIDDRTGEVFVELAPHPVLSYYVREIAAEKGLARDCAQVPAMLRTAPCDLELAVFVQSLAALHQWHVPVAWTALAPFDAAHYALRFVPTPTYAWQKRRYWLQPPPKNAAPVLLRTGGGVSPAIRSISPAARTTSPKKGSVSVVGSGEDSDEEVAPILETEIARVMDDESREWVAQLVKPSPLEWVFDHVGFGSTLVPGVTYLEAAMEASLRVNGPGLHILEDIRFHKPLFFNTDHASFYTAVVNHSQYDFTVNVKSTVETDTKTIWQHHAAIQVQRNREQYEALRPPRTPVETLLARCPQEHDGKEYYDALWERGLQLGPAFRSIKRIFIGEDEVVAEMSVPTHLHIEVYQFVPPVLDATMQCLGAILLRGGEGIHGIFLPYHMDRLMRWDRPPRDFYVHIKMHESNNRYILGDVYGITKEGDTILHISNFRCNYVEDTKGSDMFYDQHWQEIEPKVPSHVGLDGVATIVFADTRAAHCDAVTAAIANTGKRVVTVRRGAAYKKPEANGLAITARDSAEDIARAIEDAVAIFAQSGDDSEVRSIRILYGWTLDAVIEDDTKAVESAEAALSTQLRDVSIMPFVHIVHAIQARGSGTPAQLWVVTQCGRYIVTGEKQQPLQGAIWGMAGIAAQEYAQIKVVLADLGAAPSELDTTHLAGEFVAGGSGEDQIGFRDGQVLASRLAQAGDPATTRVVHGKLSEHPCRLEIAKAGHLDGLVLRAIPRTAPGPGEVEVEVRAAGLNFRDTLRAMGLYPAEEDTPAVGLEAAGVISRVGEGVTEFKVGDEVIGIGSGSFGTHITTPAAFCAPRPRGMNMEEAAALTGVLMTAYVSLVWIGHVAAGERVLIHSAAGGVGLAAVQICKHFGCEIFATVGRKEKREYLERECGIPADHIFSSRNVGFVDGIRELTNGEGIDVVLNSLMGEGLLRSFELLRHQGRFLEIGKRDIFENTGLGMKPFSRNTVFAAVAVDEIFKRSPAYASRLLREVVSHMDDGTYRPIPVSTWPLPKAHLGFRYMASAQHIGKIVVTVNPDDEADVVERAADTLREDATYLLIGFGGMGLEIARWLFKRGARSVVALTLFLSDAWKATADEFRAQTQTAYPGARFEVVECDVCNAAALEKCLAAMKADPAYPPVRGVIHAAGVLDDKLLKDVTPASVARVFAPKVDGAWNLHVITQRLALELDFFVVFSSIAALMGTIGQGSYAAANAFLDSLAALRRAQHLPAAAICWGPARLGMTARQGDAAIQAMEAQGLSLLTRTDFTDRLGQVILAALPRELPHRLAVIKMDWAKWSSFNAVVKTKRFSGIVKSAGASTVAGRQFLQDFFALPADGDARKALLTAKIVHNVATVLSFPEDELDVNKPLNEMGLDSMIANEVRVKIEQEIGVPMSIASLIGGPPIAKLASSILSQIEAMGEEGALGDDPSATLSIAVELAEGDEKLPPIFAVCPAGGQATIFADLAKALSNSGSKRRFIALQKGGSCQSLKELAAAHVRSIKKRWDGPYTIFGHSLGAVVGHEIVAQLVQAGAQVDAFVLLDPSNKYSRDSIHDPLEMAMLLFALGRARCDPDDLARALAQDAVSGAARWEHFFSVAQVAPEERNGYRLAVNEIADEVTLFTKHVFTETFPDEKTGKLPYHIGIIHALGNHPRGRELLRTDLSNAAWQEVTHTSQTIPESGSPGNHWTMFEGENAVTLAGEINKMLDSFKKN